VRKETRSNNKYAYKKRVSRKSTARIKVRLSVALSLSRSFASSRTLYYEDGDSLFFLCRSGEFFFLRRYFFWLGFRVFGTFFFTQVFFSFCVAEKRTHTSAETCWIISRFSLSHTLWNKGKKRASSCERRAILSSSTVVLVVVVLPLRALLFLLLL